MACLLRRLPSGRRSCVVVLDKVGLHVARLVQKAAHALSRKGLRLFYLSAYSPQLNDVEAVLQVVKHHELPERTKSRGSVMRPARSSSGVDPPCGALG